MHSNKNAQIKMKYNFLVSDLVGYSRPVGEGINW